jgi:ribosomal protein S27E
MSRNEKLTNLKNIGKKIASFMVEISGYEYDTILESTSPFLAREGNTAVQTITLDLPADYRYLDCGDLHCGFARVKCKGCGHEYLLAFSCKRRHFCPSCHQKRVIEFGEWLCMDVLKFVPHRQWVFSIPKRLRIYFMFDRKLLPKFFLCAWKVLSTYLNSD